MKTNILVVDDTRDNLRLLQSILTEQGYLVRPVSVGARAIAGAQSKPPDLILLDIMMPDMDGYAVCKALKADNRTRDIPVIFISALNETFDKVKAFSLGGVDYITKPFQPEEVLARVKTHLTLRNLQKQLQHRNNQLQQTNEQLTREIADRKHAEEELKHAKDAALEAQRRALEAKEAAEAAQRASEAAQRASEDANRAKSTFLANMSHELRSPLNAILGFTQVMARSQNLPSEYQEHVDIIRRSGEHLLTLINQVLELSKIEAGRITLNLTTVDLHQLLYDVQDMFALRAETKGLQLVFEHNQSLPQYIRTDDIRLRQVLINLLNNAIKFTEKGGVTVRVSSQQSAVSSQQSAVERLKLPTAHCPLPTAHCPLPTAHCPLPTAHCPLPTAHLFFEIEDTGPGIAADEIDTVFEAFKQTDTGRQSQEGTGLGLPISRKFVQMMGGDIQVASQVGHGTTFTFDIRCELADAIDTQHSPPTNRPIALEPGQRIPDGGSIEETPYRLLIAEDKPDNRRLLAVLLEPFGFDLREAANGQEAIDIWKEWKPHLIWMDMRMPAMDGYEATRKIRALGTQSSVPSPQSPVIIALTANAYEEQRAEMFSAGCDDYLRKPFRDVEIFEMLHKHLGVRFVYKEEQQGTGSKEQVADQNVLTPEALAALPSELVNALKEAATFCEIEVIHQVITEIRRLNAPLADVLAHLAEQFEYDEILMLVQGEEAP